MSIQTDCPYCGNSAKVRDEVKGRKIKCPDCKKPYVVGEDEGKTPCPECEALMSRKGIICVACGYNIKTGDKLETTRPLDLKTKRKERQKEEMDSETRNLLTHFLIYLPAFSVAGALGVGFATRAIMSGGGTLPTIADLPVGFVAVMFTIAAADGWYLWLACNFREFSEEAKREEQRRRRRWIGWALWGMLLVSVILIVVVLGLVMPAEVWQETKAKR